MKKFARLIAVMLSLVTLLGMLAACADNQGGDVTTDGSAQTNAPGVGNDSENEATTVEETLYALDDLDEKYNFNETITIFLWSDYRMREFYAEETGDIIDDSIYRRNEKVADRLGVTFEFVEEKGSSSYATAWIQHAENDRAADNELDIYAGYSRTLPMMSLKGMTVNLLEYDAFNVEKPWWPEALTTECTINDRLYFCTGDIATSVLWYMNALMYNKELYAQNISSEKTPIDMVLNDEWDIDTFFTMVKDIYIDDGNQTKDKLDFFGATIYSTDLDAFMVGANITSLEKTEDGGLRISEAWNSQRCADICELVGNYIKEPGVLSSTARTPFSSQNAIFHLDRIFIIKGIDNGTFNDVVDFPCGVVPVPKYDSNQEKYRTNLGNPYTIYGVNSSSRKIEAAVTTLEAMGSENYRTVTPAVFEVVMKVRYSDDPQTAEVFDMLKEGISFDFGKLYGDNFGNTTSNLWKNTASSGNPAGFLSALKASERVIDTAVQSLLEAYGK